MTAMHGVLGVFLLALAVGAQAEPVAGKPRPPVEAHAQWVGSWAVAPYDFQELAINPAAVSAVGAVGIQAFRGQTLRQLVRPTLDGERVRIRFSNVFGKTPLHIAAASVGLGTGASSASPASLRELRFNGRGDLTVEPGTEAWSDGIDLKVEAGQDVVVSTFMDQLTPFATISLQDLKTSWVVVGNGILKPKLEGAIPMALNHIVTGLDVWSREPALTVVAFGDSITAGGGEAGEGAYPDLLATRLRDSPRAPKAVSVLNEGIGGNRLLLDGSGPSGLSRFARDALGQSGVTHVIVLLGTNDIGRKALVSKAGLVMPPGEMPTTQRIIAGLAQLIAQARAKGVRVLIGTVPPFKNGVYWTKDTDAMRDEVNRWIRGRKDVDGVIDFDAALRDPADPAAMDPKYDSGDHLHPGKAGRAAMAAAVDVRGF
ncbi:GDSL-type esterase/lipase family protein [Variovorax sp. PAMC26660]|uniref:GDSL-type esterase/lipase family protein n=1 Tax=Variovorax sp. PAMC26660 TaxID=2762322 RepID=UPI0021C30538|nr:GDSL-type esterase/lipase family protein [Variovorax sp. PAMC26660]